MSTWLVAARLAIANTRAALLSGVSSMVTGREYGAAMIEAQRKQCTNDRKPNRTQGGRKRGARVVDDADGRMGWLNNQKYNREY